MRDENEQANDGLKTSEAHSRPIEEGDVAGKKKLPKKQRLPKKTENPLQHARFEVDTEDEILIVRFQNRPGCMTHVDLKASVTTLLKNIEEAVSGYDEAVAELNASPEDTLL